MSYLVSDIISYCAITVVLGVLGVALYLFGTSLYELAKLGKDWDDWRGLR